ncbi:lycopene cyclase domain-containing protein [Leucobacter chromiisoli]|uniref:lycopene cyclase domain-containing protein n=1 Tax=Leucobacter chromiisoli TaxID=2796471 RepID=UPI0027DEA5FD|nr:lycopene cyclase domain-containing protein [Leucobacter chromiisoli]
MPLVYLAFLLLGIACMLLIDRRFRLFFWRDAAAASMVTLAGTAFLLLWDAAGIAGGIFLRGGAGIASGVVLAPELPLEEPVFLVFLVLCTMVLYTGLARLLQRRRRNRTRRRLR